MLLRKRPAFCCPQTSYDFHTFLLDFLKSKNRTPFEGEPSMAENDKDRIPSDDYERELETDLDDKTRDRPRGLALHTKILIGLLVGVIGGLIANQSLGGSHPNIAWFIRNIAQPIGSLFLNLLLLIVVPLVFSSLVVGVAGIGDIRKLGRIGVKSFGYCLVISAISVVIGLTLANTIRPGERVSPDVAAQLKEKYSSGAAAQTEAQAKAAEAARGDSPLRSEEHTSELQSRLHLVCRLLLEKKKNIKTHHANETYDELHTGKNIHTTQV